MKNMMRKSTFREIRGSFSRWAAILAIVALGVGFFTGLKVSREAFVVTGDKYLKENNLFDFQLISTLGFEDENIDEIAAVSGVNSAVGSWSQDAVVTVSRMEGESVAKLHTINDKINTPVLIAGDLPASGNECLADSNYFGEDSIGQTITVVKTSNDEDAEEILAYDEYIISGLAQSPLYMNYERGSTSLGSGSVAFFLLLPEDGWDADYYTEMYVDADAGGEIFSDEYNDAADAMEKPLETALENSANGRYDDIMTEANEELAEAEEKLADAKIELADAEKELADGERELKDAEKKLRDGEDELAENEQKLDDARADLEKARADYEEGLAQYNQEKADAYAQLDELLASFEPAKGTPFYAQYYAQYEAAKAEADAQFEAAWAELEDGRLQIEDGEREVEEGLAAIEDAKKEIADGKREIADGKKEIADGKREIADAKKELSDAEEELDDARDEIEDIENPDTYVLGRDTNIGYVCFDSDTAIVAGLSKVFPVFFFIVAALVVMTTMTRMVDEQRTQIGVLKALGYSKGQILGKYIFYSSSAALMGGIAGFFAGSYLFPYVIWVAYNMMYGFAPLTFVLNWVVGGACIAVALVCALSATMYSCYRELSEVPAQLIRPKAPALGKRILLERIHFIWDRLPFLHKVSMRNIFRYKKRFFMMVLGICGCTALLVTGFGIGDTIKTVVPSQYDEIYFVDYTVTFDKDINEDEKAEFLAENIDTVSDALFLYTISVDAQANNSIKTVNMVVAKNDDPVGKFIDLHTEDGIPIEYPAKGECIINTNLARMMKLDIGDDLTVFDSDKREITAEITAICENYVNNYFYINDETYEEFYGDLETNAAFVKGISGEDGKVEDPHGDGAKLMNADNVAAVSVTMDFKDRIATTLEGLNAVILLVIICAGALAFIVLYNLTNINITERIREIATIKVLGFYPNETSAYVFRENLVLTAVSALVGLPLGTWLNQFVMGQVKIDLMYFDIHVLPASYIYAVVMTFIFAGIVNFAMYFRLQKISMTESLKSIE